MNKGIVFLGMGFEMVALCMGGYFLGNHVDAYMGWETKSSAYLILLLLVGWFWHFMILVRKFQKENDDPGSGPPN